jgi:phage gp36-like protein
MAYVTQQEMIGRFGEDELILLTDRAGVGVIDVTVLQKAMEDASAIMDGYLGMRYPVPLADPVPESVSVHAADLARCQLYDSSEVDKAEARCQRVFEWLVAVSEGRVVLPGVPPLPDGGSSAITSGQRETVFSNACLDKMPGVTCP